MFLIASCLSNGRSKYVHKFAMILIKKFIVIKKKSEQWEIKIIRAYLWEKCLKISHFDFQVQFPYKSSSFLSYSADGNQENLPDKNIVLEKLLWFHGNCFVSSTILPLPCWSHPSTTAFVFCMMCYVSWCILSVFGNLDYRSWTNS